VPRSPWPRSAIRIAGSTCADRTDLTRGLFDHSQNNSNREPGGGGIHPADRPCWISPARPPNRSGDPRRPPRHQISWRFTSDKAGQRARAPVPGGPGTAAVVSGASERSAITTATPTWTNYVLHKATRPSQNIGCERLDRQSRPTQPATDPASCRLKPASHSGCTSSRRARKPFIRGRSTCSRPR